MSQIMKEIRQGKYVVQTLCFIGTVLFLFLWGSSFGLKWFRNHNLEKLARLFSSRIAIDVMFYLALGAWICARALYKWEKARAPK